ncbi:TATA box-binding protein-associated factor RNA polymerase I subunit D isoform X2 [Macrotis lagotis]|uniref:TATA box-binding protein-associated factor RNA polymerase I subunit D isoform X2 n=1 Tax=Macrotis lagotis TaxID=92651 RepID=UPI003D68D949
MSLKKTSLSHTALASAGSLVNNETDDSDSSNSLFKTQRDPASPKRKPRDVSTSNVIQSTKNCHVRDDSSQSSSELEPFNLRVVFDNWKNKKRRKRKKYKPTGRPRGRPKGKLKEQPLTCIKYPIKDKGLQFPLIESEDGNKSLHWKEILGYEQAVARGFFNYVKERKSESHLREALKQLDVDEGLEEDLSVRRYKYLDDEGSLSPIEETDVEDRQLDDKECDVKLVEFALTKSVVTANYSGERYPFRTWKAVEMEIGKLIQLWKTKAGFFKASFQHSKCILLQHVKEQNWERAKLKRSV